MTEAQLKTVPREILNYFNDTPDLQSLAYDLDLMPEQCETDHQIHHMVSLACWHMNKFKEEKPK